MSLAPGTRLGTYVIAAPLGSGGMGEVYRAHDGALKRDVAIKILPAGAESTADREARFHREAQVLASLNHPNIAHIYGLTSVPGLEASTAIVMELIEGPTLADLLSARKIAIPEALVMARQIADALDAAHELGIVHRDLKPANIKVRGDSTVKVLDFGLAKVIEAAPSSVGVTQAPTILSTEPGLIVGTAPYMSPEQVRGGAVDKRTDIWAFGCVLFEMLTGRQAFPSRTMADAAAAILTTEPDWVALPMSTPPAVRRVLTRCLEKDPRQRMRDIGDARAELADAGATDVGVARASVTPAPARRAWKIGAAAIAGAAVALAGVAIANRVSAPAASAPRAIRLSIGSPGQFFTQPPTVQISPDGRMVAFVATDDGGRDVLWIRSLDTQDARSLAGTVRADLPFWSPDSRFLGFFADGELKTIAIEDGRVQTLTKAPVSPGATWSRSGTILFAQGAGFKIIAAGGGPSSDVAGPATSSSWPHFLPDGRHFVYFQPGAKPSVNVASIDGGAGTRLFDSDYEAVYAAPGYLLFVRDETLLAQPFDAATLTLSGAPEAITSSVWVARGYGHGAFSVADNGTIAYVNAAMGNTQLAWFDAAGRPLGTVGPPGRYDSPPQISPDGSAVAVSRGPYSQQDIWELNPGRDTSTRLTFDQVGSRVPIWLRDKGRLLFQSPRGDGVTRAYVRSADGGADERVGSATNINLQDVSPDGRSLVYMTPGKNHRFELWTMPLAGGEASPFLHTDANNGQAQISPDGKWIAYVSNESGREEVFVQSFPQPGNKRQVSDGGGAQPRWRKTGGELFYLAPDRALMAVPVQTAPTLQTGRPVLLFRTRLEFLALQGPLFMPGYDVTPDGQRFLLNAPATAAVPPIDIVLNWTTLLKNGSPGRSAGLF